MITKKYVYRYFIIESCPFKFLEFLPKGTCFLLNKGKASAAWVL